MCLEEASVLPRVLLKRDILLCKNPCIRILILCFPLDDFFYSHNLSVQDCIFIVLRNWKMITLTIIFCLQASPLDICFDSFYTSRKEMIDKRLEEITSAPVQVDGCYSLHCSLLVSQIFGTNCSCFLIFLISETSGNGLQNMGWSRRRALCRPQLGSVHKCGTSKGVFNNLVVFLSCAIGLWEVQWPNG